MGVEWGERFQDWVTGPRASGGGAGGGSERDTGAGGDPPRNGKEGRETMDEWLMRMGKRVVVGVGTLVMAVIVGFWMVEVVPPGHVKVGKLFGEVEPEIYRSGMHIVNPLLTFAQYDVRHKSYTESGVSVMSQDQLRTEFDVSVQFRLRANDTPRILSDTGTLKRMVKVHMEPALRSALREEGKATKRAEEFALETTQERIQRSLEEKLRVFLAEKGVEIQQVLLRDIRLPDVINLAVEEKKKREQAAEAQKAELARFEVEQEQLVATAQAELDAAKLEAEQVKVRADAEALRVWIAAEAEARRIGALAAAQENRIERLNKAMSDNPAYLHLRWMEALEVMGQDPSAKFFFLSEGGEHPIPLLHLGTQPGGSGG